MKNKKNVRIGIIASGGGTTADVVMKAHGKGIIQNGEVVLLISTKKEAGCLQKAEDNDVLSVVIEKERHPEGKRAVNRIWNEKLQKIVKERDINMLILAGCVNEVHPISGVYIVNTHPANTRKHGGRGMYALEVHKDVLRKIKEQIEREQRRDTDEFTTVVTFHEVDRGIDTGRPILKTYVPIPLDIVQAYVRHGQRLGRVAKHLQQHVLQWEYAMLPSAVNAAILNILNPVR